MIIVCFTILIFYLLNCAFIIWRLSRSIYLYQYYMYNIENDPKFRTLFCVGRHGGFLKEEKLLKHSKFYATGSMQGFFIIFIMLYFAICVGLSYLISSLWFSDVNFGELAMLLILNIYAVGFVYCLMCVLFVVVFEKYKVKLSCRNISDVNLLINKKLFRDYEFQNPAYVKSVVWVSLFVTYLSIVLLSIVATVYLLSSDWITDRLLD